MKNLNIEIENLLMEELKIGAIKADMSLKQYVSSLLEKCKK